MTLPTTTTLNDCEPDDSDMFGPPRSSPPPSHHRGIDGTNNHNHRSRVPMISPKLRQREERKRILQLCAHKLERIKDSETNLRRSVCINNTYCRLNDELRREKQSRYLANLPKSESKPETAHDNIFNPYNSCSLDSSNHQSNAQQQHNNNTISSNDSNNNNNKSNSNSTSTAAQSTNSYLHNHHNRLHKNHLNIVDVDDDEDDNDGIDEEDDDIDDAIINNRYDSDMNNSLCDIENQPALGHHQGQLGYNNNNNSSNNNNNNSHKQHATETYSSCVATSHALIENLNQNLNIITTTSLLNGPSMNINTITSALSTITTTTTHTTTVSSSSSSVTNTSIAPATITSTATATATATQISPRKRHISSNNIDTDLERLDRELNAINAPMLLIDPEITQGAEHLERAISSRKRLRSEDESDRLVREALQFYIPPQRFISAIEDCPLDIVGVGNCGLNMGNISPKRQKLSSQDLDLDFDVNQNSKDFEVIMDALRLGTPSPTSSDSCGQAAMMSEAASVFHNLVVTSLET